MTHVLLRSIHIGLALLLVAPLIVTFDALSPFIVGKSLYSRVLIEVMAVLWVILMIRNPTFRPPRSWILLAFAAYAWSLCSPQYGALASLEASGQPISE